MMMRGGGLRLVSNTWGVNADSITQMGCDPGLVDRRPHRHPVAKGIDQNLGIARETLDDFAVRPAPSILKRLRKVPVIERRYRPDATSVEAVDHPRVKFKSLQIGRTRPKRLDARPRDRKAIDIHTEPGDQIKVCLQTMVVVAGDIAGITVKDALRLVAVRVPNGCASAILKRGAFDLIRRRRNAPGETLWKFDR